MQPSTVTAQDLWDVTCDFVDKETTISRFDALLARVRQEAREKQLEIVCQHISSMVELEETMRGKGNITANVLKIVLEHFKSLPTE